MKFGLNNILVIQNKPTKHEYVTFIEDLNESILLIEFIFPKMMKTDFELSSLECTVELQWFEHLRNHENMFETGVVRAKEC